MRLLVDAQLPRRFCASLSEAGHDAVHTLELPKGNRTSDGEIPDVAEREQRIVVTKDDDFVQSFLIAGRPPKPLLVSTGNIGNDELEAILRAHINEVAGAFESAAFVELSRKFLTVHE